MPDQTAVDRIPIAHSVRYAARGLPNVPNQYGPGVLAPSEITLTYRAAPDSQLGRVHAYVAGRIWVDGTELPLLPSGLYGQHYDDGLDGWPAWLADEARLHDPAVPAPATDQAAPRVGRATCPDREPLLRVQCVKEAGHEVHSDRPGRIWYPVPDDTDVTEADVDRMMAAGTPVQIVTGPPATYGANESTSRPDQATAVGQNLTFTAPTDRAAARAAAPVKQRADCTELEWAVQERARFERLYTRETVRADLAETRAEAMERAMESTAADASAHRFCHMRLMAQCQRAEQAEAEAERLHDKILALQAELASGRDLLRTENQRANSAIDRETTAEEVEEERRLSLSDALGLGTGAPWDAVRDRTTELETENERMRHELEVMYGGAFDSHKPASVDRAAVLREAADGFDRHAQQLLNGIGGKAVFVAKALRDQAAVWSEAAETLRRTADEAQQPEAREVEDPARIDRIRPEFTEHSSVEAIDAQLQRARSQQRRWHLRAEWLISLRQRRVDQKARGEWPAASDATVQQPKEA